MILRFFLHIFAVSYISDCHADTTSPNTRSTTTQAKVVMVVNDDPITDYDIKERSKIIALFMQRFDLIEKHSYNSLEEIAIEQLINDKIKANLARNYVSSDINAAANRNYPKFLERIATICNTSIDDLPKVLKELRISMQKLKEMYEIEFLWDAYFQHEARLDQSMRAPKEGDVSKQMKKYSDITANGGYYIKEIYLPVMSSQQAVTKQAEEIINSIVKFGVPFESMALQFSKAPTGVNGGVREWCSKKEFAPNVAEAIERAKGPMDLQVVKVKNGCYIINVLGKLAPGQESIKRTVIATIGIPISSDYSLSEEMKVNQVYDELKKVVDKKDKNLLQSYMQYLSQNGVHVGMRMFSDSDEVNPEIKKIIDNLETGTVSNKYHSENAVHIVVLVDRNEQKVSFPDMQQVKQMLIATNLKNFEERMIRKAVKDSVITKSIA